MITHLIKVLFLWLISAQTLRAYDWDDGVYGDHCIFDHECGTGLECCSGTETCCYYYNRSINLTSVFVPLVLIIFFAILMIYCCVKKCNRSVQAPVTTTAIISTNPQTTTYATGPQLPPNQQYYPSPTAPYQTGAPLVGTYPPPPPGTYLPPSGGTYPPPVGVCPPNDQPPAFNTLYNQPPPPIGFNQPVNSDSAFISGDPPPYNGGK